MMFKLGPKMFASQISISLDGQVAHVVMYWQKDLDFPAKWTWQFKFQSWNIYTHTMVREIKYPEGWAALDLEYLETHCPCKY